MLCAHRQARIDFSLHYIPAGGYRVGVWCQFLYFRERVSSVEHCEAGPLGGPPLQT